ncbi:unnamed protein product [Brassica oleracea var. botrytis]
MTQIENSTRTDVVKHVHCLFVMILFIVAWSVMISFSIKHVHTFLERNNMRSILILLVFKWTLKNGVALAVVKALVSCMCVTHWDASSFWTYVVLMYQSHSNINVIHILCF